MAKQRRVVMGAVGVLVIGMGAVAYVSQTGDGDTTLESEEAQVTSTVAEEFFDSNHTRMSPLIVSGETEALLYGGFALNSSGAVVGALNDASIVVSDLSQRPIEGPNLSAPLAEPVGFSWDGNFLVIGKLCNSVEALDSFLECSPGRPAASVYSAESGQWEEVELPPEISEAMNPYLRVEDSNSDFAVVKISSLAGASSYWVVNLSTLQWTSITPPTSDSVSYCIDGKSIYTIDTQFDNAGTLLESDPRFPTVDGERPGRYSGSVDDAQVNPQVYSLPASDAAEAKWAKVGASNTEARFKLPPSVACRNDTVVAVDLTDPSSATALSTRDSTWKKASGDLPGAPAVDDRILVEDGGKLVFPAAGGGSANLVLELPILNWSLAGSHSTPFYSAALMGGEIVAVTDREALDSEGNFGVASIGKVEE